MIKTILWDIDGTILDFHSSAENSLKNTFKKFGYGESQMNFYTCMKESMMSTGVN